MSTGLVKPVLYIVDSLGLSGKTRIMAYLAAHLDRQRFHPYICTLSDEKSILIDQLSEHGVPIHNLSCKDGLDFRMVLQIAKLIHACRAQVVHCYNPRPILYGGLAAKMTGGRRTIGSLSAFACQVPDRTYGFLPQPLNTVSRRNIYRNRLAVRLLNHLVTVSGPLGKRFCEYNGIPTDKLRVIPYGADLGAVARITPEEVQALRRELGYTAGEFVIGSVGRLVEQKDYPTQLRAFAAAAAQVPELRMLLAGDGPLEAPMRELVRSLNLDERVRFLGHWERVPLLLRSLDAFVLASKFEPFGVALLEAKAAGLPIVSTNVNEIPDILSNGESGLLSPPGDPDSMAALFVKVAKDPTLRARLGQTALQEARERHSLESNVRDYQELYDSAPA